MQMTENMSTTAVHQAASLGKETYDGYRGVSDENLDEIECIEEVLRNLDGDDCDIDGEAGKATGGPMTNPEASPDRLSHQSIIGSGPSTELSVPLLPSATGTVASFWKSCPGELMEGVKELLSRLQPAFGKTYQCVPTAFTHDNLYPDPDVPNLVMVKHSKLAEEEVMISGGRIEHLVSPTGTLVDRMGILLHWPTFSTTSNWNSAGTGNINAK